MIVCTQCGNHNQDDDEFCGSCGKFLEWVGEKIEEPAPPPPPPEPEVEQEPERRGIVDRVRSAVGFEDDDPSADPAASDAPARDNQSTDEAPPDEAAAAAADAAARAEEDRRQAEAEAQRLADEAARQAATEEARRQQAEAERQAQTDAEREREAERQAQAERERETEQQAQAEAELQRQAEAAEREREAQAAEAERKAAAAQAERERQAEAEREAEAARAEAEAERERQAEEAARAAKEAADRRAAAMLARPRGQTPTTPPPTPPPDVRPQAESQPSEPEPEPEHEEAAGNQPTAYRPTSHVPDDRTVSPPRPEPKKVAPTRQIKPGDLICGECGEGNDPQRRFCRKCGHSLAEAVAATRPPWWRRLFSRDKSRSRDPRDKRGSKRKGAGQQARGAGRAAKSAGFQANRAMYMVRRGLMLLALIGIVGIVALPGPRGAITDTVSTWFTKAKLAVAPEFVAVNPVAAEATSAAPGHEADKLIDGASNTYWAEGVPGDGVDQIVTVHFPEPTDLDKIIVTSGASGEDPFLSQPRPRVLHIVYDTGGGMDIEVRDESDPGTYDLEGATQVTTLQIQIAAVYPSAQGGDNTAISELEFRSRRRA